MPPDKGKKRGQFVEDVRSELVRMSQNLFDNSKPIEELLCFATSQLNQGLDAGSIDIDKNPEYLAEQILRPYMELHWPGRALLPYY